MPIAPRIDRAVHYACAVSTDLRISRLPADPFAVAQGAGIALVPLSGALANPGWFPPDLAGRMLMNSILTLTFPTFCIIYRDDLAGSDRLRFLLCHELGHLFMNHYRDFPDQMASRVPSAALEAEADAFARNLLAPVPVVDVIRFNRPRQARASLFGFTRAGWLARLDALPADRACVDEETANTLVWLYRDWLLGRRCAACGHTFRDTRQADVCPRCGAPSPDWDLEPGPSEK